MTHPLIRAVRDGLAAQADPARAPQMQRYMKSRMPYYGVDSPTQRRIWRDVFAAHPLDSCEALRSAALTLWRGASYREERYAAIGLTDLRRYAACQTYDAVPLYEEFIVTGAWWDYVDAVATHQLGDVLRNDARRMKPVMRRWSRSNDSMWKRRAAILCQVRFKADTDLDLLYACIEPNLAHTDFFIRKAIGWALRQYARTDPREVNRYVNATRARLSPLSAREATKNINVRA
jgi:3-methyladenine DNA glycosylase AlkD